MHEIPKAGLQKRGKFAASWALACGLMTPAPATRADDSQTVIVVGGAAGDLPSPTLKRLQERMEHADPKTTYAVFTGNYAKAGEMPGKDHEDRAAVERDVRAHIDAVRRFAGRGGRVFFLPGHRDHAGRGRKGVRRLRKFIHRALQSTTSTAAATDDDDEPDEDMPHPDCGDPTVIEMGATSALVLLNTQWWLQDWEANARTNEGCELKTRAQFGTAFLGIIKKYRTRRVIVALHHPLESLGRYGGHFPAFEHIEPPILGSLWIWARQGGLVPQYRNHPRYATLVSSLLGTAEKFGAFVFASGHDRNLQLLRTGGQVQIVSGFSGREAAPVTDAGDGEFAHRAPGWAEVQLDAAGEGRVVFVDGATGRALFKSKLPPLTRLGEPDLPDPPPIPPGRASSTYAKRSFGRTNFFESIFLGDHYRNAYALDLDFDVLDLATEAGGLTPVKVGGGNQTNSLRLEDPTGGQWALRSTSKDASRFLPYPMNKVGFLNNLLEDGFTATHPAAALAVPPLAEAVGVYHTRPRLLYLPDQAGLEGYRGYINDEVVLLERRPKRPKTGTLPAHLGGSASPYGPTKYRSTTDLIAKIHENPWKHRVDQEMMLRARLLDIFLGDWDRHEDQWRFAAVPMADGTKLYRPIPRDRDQAFAHYDGLMLFLARLAAPGIRVLRPFGEDIGDLTWLTYNGRHIDPVFLNRIPRGRWMEIAREVQAALTDEVIADGLARWAPDAYALDGKEVERKLRARRDGLLGAAADFFALRNATVEVTGSNHRDAIDLTFEEDERITLSLSRAKDGPDAPPYYLRTFDAAHTGELRIYGLSGRDTLAVHGRPHGAITVRFIGGSSDDTVLAGRGPNGASRPLAAPALCVYDRKKGLEIDNSIEVTDRRSGTHYQNQYDVNDAHHEPPKAGFFAGFVINPDDGLYLGATSHLTLYGFKRSPYASFHQLSAFLATTTLGVEAAYTGLFPRTVGPFDQELRVSLKTPTHTRNFFGITNRYIDTEPQGREFYRVRQGQATVRYGLGFPATESLRFGLHILGRWIEAEATEGRFVVQSPDVPATELEGRYFVGAAADARIDTFDSAVYPKRGIVIGASARLLRDVTNDPTGTSATFAAALATHIPFDRTERLVLSTRGRIEAIVGNYPFYFLPTLGDRDIRAFNAEQLAANAVFGHSTDLRLEVIRIREGLPSAIGLAGSIDHGRAFGPDVSGGRHHVAVGGSVFWNILNTVGLSVGYYRGLPDGERLVIGLGPLFAATGLEP